MKLRRFEEPNPIKNKVAWTRSNDSFYNTSRWRRISKLRRAHEPLCRYCLPKITDGQVCDHVRPRRLFPELEYSYENTATSCKKCHDKKSAKETRIRSREEYERKMKEYINKKA